MNRFRTKKRAKDGVEVQEDTSSTVAHSSPSKGFRWNRKQQQEAQPELDITLALPSSEDFRTSLLMPNLSARFSMLREQDDPNSKLGKANDDSVLFPKRVSRLNLFVHNPLTDIDEVASLKGSIRPPFTLAERSNSFASEGGYGTDDDSTNGGSMMSRSKPGQGNNLFSGRQKLYQIPMGGSSSRNVVSPDSPGVESPRMNGRVIYENDVTLSAFQKLKQREKDESRRSEEDDFDGNHATEHEESGMANSPTTPFSKNRGTTSSTNSGPSNKRTSTAATSIDSQPPGQSSVKTNSQSQASLDRQATIHKRLYGQALDQVTSTRDLFENVSRQRAASNEKAAHLLLQSKSTSSINERFQRSAPVYTSSTFRTASPPPSASPPTVPMDLGIRKLDTGAKPGEHAYGYVPPLSPPISDSEGAATFSKSVQPEDRGKATAMGLFNKPRREYDEQQFSQRQMQMHSSAARPFTTRTPPPTTALPSIPTKTASRASSTASSGGSRPQSSNLDRHRESPNAISVSREPALPPVTGSPTEQDGSMGTFLDTLSHSDESDFDRAFADTTSQQQPDVHPAFRLPRKPVATASSHHDWIPKTSSASESSNDHQYRPKSVHDDARSDTFVEPLDSPTLGPTGGIGGLIRTHLRHDSERSTIPPNSPRFPPGSSDETKADSAAVPARSWNQPESMHSDPWEYDDAQRQESPKDGTSQENHQIGQNGAITMSAKARQILGQATALRDQKQSKVQQVLGDGAPRSSSDERPPSRTWQEEMRARHNRNESSDTQKEKEEFHSELAERRRRVQENLKSVVEVDSRSGSPLPQGNSEVRATRAGNAFAKLRPRPSKQQIMARQAEAARQADTARQADGSSKAMKMLGIGAATMHSMPNKAQGNMWRQEEETMLQGFAPRSGSRPPRSPVPAQTYHHSPPRVSEGTHQAGSAASERTAPAEALASSASSRRDRSSSDVSSRSKSRNGRYRDDLEQAMDQGQGRMSRDAYASPMPTSGAVSSRPSIDTADHHVSERAPSAASGRYRSNSRPSPNPAATDYFDTQNVLPIQTNLAAHIGLSPRPSPSPITPYSANSLPSSYTDHSPAYTPTEPYYPGSMSTPNLPMQPPPPRKRSVTKRMISEPTFVSTTSSLSTIGLPHGASVRNGMEHAVPSSRQVFGAGNAAADLTDTSSPPLPMMNPRRRRTTTTQTLVQGAGGRQTPTDQMPTLRAPNNLNISVPGSPLPLTPGSAVSPYSTAETRSNFSDDAFEKHRPRQRQRLRKSSSEGGAMNSRARAERMKGERSPGLPMHGMERIPGLPMQGTNQIRSPSAQGSRSRTPTTMMNGGYSHMNGSSGIPRSPYMGKPPGWQGPPMHGPPPMGAMSRVPHSPMMNGAGPGRYDGRSATPYPPPGAMRAPSRQKGTVMDGAMF